MTLEKAIDMLKNFNDGYTFQQCQTCFKFNEKDSCCNKEKCEELQAIDVILKFIENKEEK